MSARMTEHGSTPVPALRVGRPSRSLAVTTPRPNGHRAPSNRVVCDLPAIAETVEVMAALLSEARRGDAIALQTIADLAIGALEYRNAAARVRMDDLGIPADVPIPCDDVLAVLWDRVELYAEGDYVDHWRWLGTTNNQGVATMALPRRSPLSSPSGTRHGSNQRAAGRVLYEGLRGPVGAPFLARTCGGLHGKFGDRKAKCVNPWHGVPSRWAGNSGATTWRGGS